MGIGVSGNVSNRRGADGAIVEEAAIGARTVGGVLLFLVMEELRLPYGLGISAIPFRELGITKITHPHRSNAAGQELGWKPLEGLGEGRTAMYLSVHVDGRGLAAHDAAHGSPPGSVRVVRFGAAKTGEGNLAAPLEVFKACLG